MEAIRNLVQNLIVIIILAMFLEMLLPAGDMRKYVKMVMGLLVIVAVVQTVGNLLRWDLAGDLPSLIQKEDVAGHEGIIEAGKNISEEQQQRAIEQYKQGLANQVKALIKMDKKVTVTDVVVGIQSDQNNPGFGQLKEIIIAVPREPEPELQEPGLIKVDVEPVAVQVGKQSIPQSETGIENEQLPGELSNLVNNLASLYSLKPEQVKVIYR